MMSLRANFSFKCTNIFQQHFGMNYCFTMGYYIILLWAKVSFELSNIFKQYLAKNYSFASGWFNIRLPIRLALELSCIFEQMFAKNYSFAVGWLNIRLSMHLALELSCILEQMFGEKYSFVMFCSKMFWWGKFLSKWRILLAETFVGWFSCRILLHRLKNDKLCFRNEQCCGNERLRNIGFILSSRTWSTVNFSWKETTSFYRKLIGIIQLCYDLWWS